MKPEDKNEKVTYEGAFIELVLFQENDIILTSVTDDDDDTGIVLPVDPIKPKTP